MQNPLTALTAEELRRRCSMKWRRYDPDVLPLWIAEMDTPLAEPIADALGQALDRGDTGYAHPGRMPGAFARYRTMTLVACTRHTTRMLSGLPSRNGTPS